MALILGACGGLGRTARSEALAVDEVMDRASFHARALSEDDHAADDHADDAHAEHEHEEGSFHYCEEACEICEDKVCMERWLEEKDAGAHGEREYSAARKAFWP